MVASRRQLVPDTPPAKFSKPNGFRPKRGLKVAKVLELRGIAAAADKFSLARTNSVLEIKEAKEIERLSGSLQWLEPLTLAEPSKKTADSLRFLVLKFTLPQDGAARGELGKVLRKSEIANLLRMFSEIQSAVEGNRGLFEELGQFRNFFPLSYEVKAAVKILDSCQAMDEISGWLTEQLRLKS